jgi:hypothetical protein
MYYAQIWAEASLGACSIEEQARVGMHIVKSTMECQVGLNGHNF